MNKGLIMEIKKDYAIVMNDDGNFQKIAVKPEMAVGMKIFYFEEDVINSTANKSYNINTFMKRFGSIAAIFLLVFTFVTNMMSDKTYAVVSVDVNPSIQISVDNKRNIIKVEGKNDDGKSIDFSGLKGKNINDGIREIKNILVEKNYLKDNRDVLVAFGFVKNDADDGYEESIKQGIKDTFKAENVTYVKAEDKKDITEANEQGLSLGRYEASKVVDEETKKNITNAPVKELTAQIKDNSNVIYYNSDEDKSNNDSGLNSDAESTDTSNSINGTKNDIAVTKDNAKDTSSIREDNSNNKSNSEKPKADADNKENNSNVDSSSTQAKEPQQTEEIELEPEKPAVDATKPSQNDKDEEIIKPGTGSMENSTTSNKIEDNNKGDNGNKDNVPSLDVPTTDNTKTKTK